MGRNISLVSNANVVAGNTLYNVHILIVLILHIYKPVAVHAESILK